MYSRLLNAWYLSLEIGLENTVNSFALECL